MFARFADGCCAFSPEKLKYINLDNDSVNELKVGMDAEYVLTEIALKSFEARLPSNVFDKNGDGKLSLEEPRR